MNVNVYVSSPALDAKVDRILEELRNMAENIADLTAAEDAEGAAISSLVATQATAIQKITDLLGQIVGAGGNQAAIDALTAEAQGHAKQLTDANTALSSVLSPAPPAPPASTGDGSTGTSG